MRLFGKLVRKLQQQSYFSPNQVLFSTQNLGQYRGTPACGHLRAKTGVTNNYLTPRPYLYHHYQSYNHLGMTTLFTTPRKDTAPKASLFDLKSQTSTEGEENDWHSDSPIVLGFRSQMGTPCLKAKTSLCKNFTEKGYCSYGRKCQFAHGPDELRVNMEHNRSYKTKTCHAFSKKGCCHFGERCNFIHEQPSAKLSQSQWQTIYSNFRGTFDTPEGQANSRLLPLINP